MTDNVDTTSTTGARFIGRVKWFNNKAGYGFITVTDGAQSGSDMFVHHSAIAVASQQYKYLVQGEYVEFNSIKSTSGRHEWQASNVSGVRGGKLMCETKNDLKNARNDYRTQKTVDEPSEVAEAKKPRQRVPQDVRKTVAPRARGEGPRDGEKKEWTLVGNSEQKPKRRQYTKKTSQEAQA